MKNNHVTLVLAAGKASRMGEAKQLLPFQNSTVLGTVLQNVVDANLGSVCCVLGSYRDQIMENLDFPTVNFITNTNWRNGMGSSIAFGVSEIIKNKSPESILIVLGDQPLISSQYLASLQAHFKRIKQSTFSHSGDYVGVPAIFKPKDFNALASLTGEQGAKRHMRHDDISLFECELNMLSDIDDKASYLKIKEMAD